MDLAHRSRLPISLLYVFAGGMNCISCDICVYHLELCVFFAGVFISRVTGACPVSTDLIMRVNVRTTTTYIYQNQLFSTKPRIIREILFSLKTTNNQLTPFAYTKRK